MDLMSGTVTIVAPSGVDGRGGTAVLNLTTSGDYVGKAPNFALANGDTISINATYRVA